MILHGYDLDGFSRYRESFQQLHRKSGGKLGLVNGHPATAREEQVLASYGFDAGAWRMDGWGISQDVAHADFVSEPRLPQCRYVLGVPLDCDGVQIASR